MSGTLASPTGSASRISNQQAARTARPFRITVDRRRLERAYAAIKPQTQDEVGPMRLECRPHQLILSTEWDGLGFSASIAVDKSRNNLPTEGLIFKAGKRFSLICSHDPLTSDSGGQRSRYLRFLIDPAANRMTIILNGEKWQVSIELIEASSIADQTRANLRFWATESSLIPWRQDDVTQEFSTDRFGFGGFSALFAYDTTAKSGEGLGGLPLGALARILTHPSNLLNRLPHANVPGGLMISEARDTCEAPVPSSEAQEVGAYTMCVLINPLAFDRMREVGEVPEHGFEFSFGCHGAIPEPPSFSYNPFALPAAFQLRPANFVGDVDVRLPQETVRWLFDTAEAGDRLLVGLRRDGTVGVLLARGSDEIAFIAAPIPADATRTPS